MTEVFTPAKNSQPAYQLNYVYKHNGQLSENRLQSGPLDIDASYQYNTKSLLTGIKTAGERNIVLTTQVPGKSITDTQHQAPTLQASSANPLKSTHISLQKFSGLYEQPLMRVDDLYGLNNYKLSYNNGHQQTRVSHPDGRIHLTTSSDNQTTRYSHNNDFLLDGIASSTTLERYQYQLGKLVSSESPHARNEYRYDNNDNRSRHTVIDDSGVVQKLSQAAHNHPASSNRITQTSTSDSDWPPPTYNAMGSQTTKDNLQFIYNSNQRLITVWEDDIRIADYTYLSNGHRLSKTTYIDEIPKTEFYFYQNGNLASIIEDNGNVAQEFLYKNDRPVLLLTKDNTYSIQTDHLKRPIAAHDKSGALAWQADYTPYGQALISHEDIKLPLRAPGQFADQETGLHYNHHRYYDPTSGRYLTSDPLGIEAGINTYEYSGGDPINHYDPLGLYLVAFDGLWQDDRTDSPTNVSKFAKEYYTGPEGEYYKGAGTNGLLDAAGAAFFGTGTRDIITEAVDNLIIHLSTSNDTSIDIIGYSRGAAQALEFANIISELNSTNGLPKNITIRFLGLFDSVSTRLTKPVRNLSDGTICQVYDLSVPDSVQYAAHAIALSESRFLFPLDSIEPNANLPGSNPAIVESAFLGTHADLGGGTSNPQDLSDISLQWMLKQAKLAGVPVKPIKPQHQHISSNRIDILRTQKELLGDRIINYPSDPYSLPNDRKDYDTEHPFFTEQNILSAGFTIGENHHQFGALSRFLNHDGSIKMKEYLHWLNENYGITPTH